MRVSSSFCLTSSTEEWHAHIPPGQLLKIAEKPQFNKLQNIEEYITEKLASSSHAQKMKKLAGQSGKVLIICDDATRPTPTSRILPILSEFLVSAGVKQENQMILFATGTHRIVSENEAFKKIGNTLWGKVKWISHDWNIDLTKIGCTPSGIPIEVNPILSGYQIIIGIGSVFPHRFCGWSGGGKIILPGVSGPESVSQTHWMPYYDNSICLGNENNLAMEEIMAAAKKAGLSFLIQCVCDGNGKLSDIILGEPLETHKTAIIKAKSIMSVKMPIADVVIAQAWPEDADLWQAGKALYAAENIVASGGHIIVTASLNEGIGPHIKYAELMCSAEEDILKHKKQHNAVGLAAAAAYATYCVRRKASLSFVSKSHFSSDITNLSGLNLYNNLDDAVSSLLIKNSKMTFSVILEAPLTLPIADEGDKQ